MFSSIVRQSESFKIFKAVIDGIFKDTTNIYYNLTESSFLAFIAEVLKDKPLAEEALLYMIDLDIYSYCKPLLYSFTAILRNNPEYIQNQEPDWIPASVQVHSEIIAFIEKR